MQKSYADIFRRHLRPLEPTPSEATADLRRLDDIHAVLFDIYGTLVISASGDVGTAQEMSYDAALAEALTSLGVEPAAAERPAVGDLYAAIEAHHRAARESGIDYPEVDIVEIWGTALGQWADAGLLPADVVASIDRRRLAVEFEARTNPCWPMPHARLCLEDVRARGLLLGIISNAQFYTLDLFEALLDRPPEGWGFDPDVRFYSFRYGRGKPGTWLYERAAERLRQRGITAGQTLYVGNDMLNDVWPAAKVGFRTALFAGDGRSLRRRENDPRLEGSRPDLVLTSLAELSDCLPRIADGAI